MKEVWFFFFDFVFDRCIIWEEIMRKFQGIYVQEGLDVNCEL